jgi:hypothetical protein
MANKIHNLLGYYILRIDMNNPSNVEYMMQWNNQLDIGNVNLDLFDEKGVKYMVVSFKSIGINTFNVIVINLETKLIRYWYESYQLWESEVTGFCLKTNDFLILSKIGINVLALSEKKNR